MYYIILVLVFIIALIFIVNDYNSKKIIVNDYILFLVFFFNYYIKQYIYICDTKHFDYFCEKLITQALF